VVAFAEALESRRARRVLDLGCGTGRHVVYLAQRGFQVCGTDISETGLAATRQWLAAEHLAAHLHLADMTALPYPEARFDAVISIYVIYHNTLGNIQRTVAEIGRVLRPSGQALLTLMSTRGHRYGQGQEIEPGTFLPESGPDAGLPHHFFDESGARALLAAFHQIELHLDEHEETEEDGSTHRHSHWVAVVEKKTSELAR
jgi:ubiquinone/menaquinone biosynthesis C-methylase UbiE